MHKQAVTSKDAPAAVGPYSHAMKSGGFLFASGQIPLDPRTGKIVEGGISAQTKQVLENVTAVLDAAGIGRSDIVKTTCFLTDMTEFAQFNEVYAGFFAEPYPARSTIGVAALPAGARVEVEVIAKLPG